MFMIQKREGQHTLTEEQVESKDGPLYRLLAIDGRPLNPNQRLQDAARLDRLLHDRNQQLKLKRGYDEDEQRLEKLMRLMPDAFVYNYDGIDGNLVRLRFRPSADYDPPTYEARVMRSLAGTILVDSQQKRLAKVSAQLINRVEFGYGLLGHIDGGTVDFRRIQVGPLQWRTAVINVQLTGRLLLFKTISTQHYEIRSNFRVVPGDLSLSDANELLVSAIVRVPAP